MLAVRDCVISVLATFSFLATPPALAGEAEDTAMSEKVLARHLAAFGAGDVEALTADYAADAIIITPTGVLHGADEFRPMGEAFVAEFGKPGVVFNVVGQTCAGRVCLLVSTAETPDNSYELAVDTFVIEDGKIVAQTFAGKIVPKGQ